MGRPARAWFVFTSQERANCASPPAIESRERNILTNSAARSKAWLWVRRTESPLVNRGNGSRVDADDGCKHVGRDVEPVSGAQDGGHQYSVCILERVFHGMGMWHAVPREGVFERRLQ